MRNILYTTIVDAVSKLVREANTLLPADVLGRIEEMRGQERSPAALNILDQIVDNVAIANECDLPLCQDTGIAIFFVDVGEDISVDGGGLEQALNDGVRKGYTDGGLRMSIVDDPFKRINTGDNTPAVVHVRLLPGDQLTITFCPKGGGCENMSSLAMLSPGQGRAGVVDFVVDTVRSGGGRPCPPLIVGVGVGGSFELSAILAKRSLLRDIGERHTDQFYSDLEGELLEKINNLGIGPMGLGGSTTALDVFVESAPCHIASLPVAVNIQCHSARHQTLEL